MSEKQRRPRRPHLERQEWVPALPLQIVHTAWKAAFAAFKIAVGTAATVMFICIICAFVFIGIVGTYLQEDIIPYAEMNLDNYDLDQTSFIYCQDTDGSIKELQQIYTTTDREWATYEEIPEDLINAAIAIEDKRFYEHQGVDWITTSKACVNMFFGSSSEFGGSTITQQLIKNLTQEDGVTVQRKVLEIFRAQQFERRYRKEVIIEWYMNTIYMGQGCYGVKTAAAAYFGKPLQDLTTAECASLISITNNPSIFDPYSEEFEYDGEMMTGAERNRARQEDTLWSMKEEGWITEEEYDAAMDQEMVFKYGIEDVHEEYACENEECLYSGDEDTFLFVDGEYRCPECGLAIDVESDDVYSWFVEAVLDDVAQALAESSGMEWNDETRATCMNLIKRGGYHIYTTLDMSVQRQVDAIYTDLSEIPEARSKQQLQSAITVVDNRTGDIVAMAGGVGKKVVFDAYNRSEAPLQTGSSIKPLTVYAPAFEMGVITPATIVKDLPFNYDDGAFPLNYERNYNYSRSVWQGVVNSVNTIAVNVLDMIGTQYSYNFAHDKFRLQDLTASYRFDDGSVVSDIDYAPLALGALTEGATVRDMTAAYATFANNGVYREPRTFTKVYDSDGNLVLDNTQDSEQILSEKSITYMNYCLDNVVDDDVGEVDVYGKTGTTSDAKDRWFCGFTGYYTAAVWCGYDTPEEINLVGDYTNPAQRLWYKVMEPLHEEKEDVLLYDYYGLSRVDVCMDSGMLATKACENDIRTKLFGLDRVDYFRVYWDDAPTEKCDKHVEVDYCTTGGGVCNEYCAQFKDVKIEKRSLLKLTQEEIDELLKAEPEDLEDVYLIDDYIYLLNENGTPGDFTGLKNNINKDKYGRSMKVPYKVCTVHTKAALDAYIAATTPTVPGTGATVPGAGGATTGTVTTPGAGTATPGAGAAAPVG